LLWDVEFHGVFVRDNGHEKIMSSDGSDEKGKQTLFASAACSHQERRIGELPARLRQSRHRIHQKSEGIVRNESDLAATIHYPRNSGTLSQCDAVAGTTVSPVLIVMQMVLKKTNCLDRQLICSGQSGFITAFKKQLAVLKLPWIPSVYLFLVWLML
jgi:hypothetical protein